MSRQLRAVARTFFRPRTGLLLTLPMTAIYGLFIASLPKAHVAISVWYVAFIAFAAGMGLRFKLTSYRAYLVPGLMEASRTFSLSLVFLALLIVLAAGGWPLASWMGVYWLVGLGSLYCMGVSRNMPIMLFGVLFLGLFGAMSMGSALQAGVITKSAVRDFVGYAAGTIESGWSVALIVVNVWLTVLVWRRIGTLRGPTWTRTGPDGQVLLFEIKDDNTAPSESLDSMPSRLPASLRERVRHFGFITSGVRPNFLRLVLTWTAFTIFFRLASPSNIPNNAFLIPLILPIGTVTLTMNVSQRMFLLPLRRNESVKIWIAALLVDLVKVWAAFVLPYNILFLATGTVTELPLPLLNATTLVAQLPVLGMVLMAATRKTASGVRKSVFVLLALFVAGVVFLALLGKVSVATGTAILLGSAVLGPVLIWLAYRRWCNAEVD